MKYRGKIAILAAAAALLVGLAAIFYSREDTGRLGHDIMLAATGEVRIVGPEDIPPPINNEGDGYRVWAVRGLAANANFNESMIAAIQFMRDAPRILERALGGHARPEMGFLAKLGISGAAPNPPSLALDNGNSGALLAYVPRNRPRTPEHQANGARWQISGSLLAAYTPLPPRSRPGVEKAPEPEKPKIVRYPRGASHYRDLVENFSRRYNLSTELVMAIIHSESDFSPHLVSSKSAMGLMQLLPSTASDEVHRFLYGRRGQVSFEQLSVPEINIRYGTAYLHILLNRYFQNVRDERVREYCAIASYNLGPNRFLKLYGPTNELAVRNINSMDPNEFYQDLASRLPTRETRFYVQKVTRMKQRYAPQ